MKDYEFYTLVIIFPICILSSVCLCIKYCRRKINNTDKKNIHIFTIKEEDVI